MKIMKGIIILIILSVLVLSSCQGVQRAGHTGCAAEIIEREQKIAVCVQEKLQELGYDDGIECIIEEDITICASDSYECVYDKMKEKGFDYDHDCKYMPLGDDEDCSSEWYDANTEAVFACRDLRDRYDAEVEADAECDEEIERESCV